MPSQRFIDGLDKEEITERLAAVLKDPEERLISVLKNIRACAVVTVEAGWWRMDDSLVLGSEPDRARPLWQEAWKFCQPLRQTNAVYQALAQEMRSVCACSKTEDGDHAEDVTIGRVNMNDGTCDLG